MSLNIAVKISQTLVNKALVVFLAVKHNDLLKILICLHN